MQDILKVATQADEVEVKEIVSASGGWESELRFGDEAMDEFEVEEEVSEGACVVAMDDGAEELEEMLWMKMS